jgi:hypothetical protein
VSLAGLLEGYATITVAGLAKNAGKTTVMNHLLDTMPGPFGLASLGLDGEARDQLTGLAKPRVRPPAGSLVATTEELAGDAPVRLRLGMRTAVGEVVVIEGTGAPVIVSGPSRHDELDRALEAVRGAGARRILLEGALGRLGTAAPGRADAVVLAAGASLANGPDDYAVRVKLALDALDLPCTEQPAGVAVEHAAGFEEETAALVPAGGSAELAGALTGPLLERLLRAGTRCTIVVADATRVLARPQQVARARRGGVEVMARRPLAIAAVTSSPFHPDNPMDPGAAFDALCAAAAGRWPVVDVVSGSVSE